MNNRLTLHNTLVTILGSNNAYFQPPESLKIQYPAIIYTRSDISNEHANNNVYKQSHHYRITVVDPYPDSEITKKVSLLPTARFEKNYAKDNLNYDVFTLFY